MTTERDNVKKKIIALLAKTQDNGATEFEAMAAAEKAAELMAVYDIEATELDFKSRSCVKRTVTVKKYGTTKVGDFFTTPIGRLCDCKIWGDPAAGEYVYFGFEQDADVAAYMYNMISNVILSELERFKSSAMYKYGRENSINGRTLTTSFLYGIEERIGGRIKEMADAKKEKVQAATGTALVIVKSERILEEFSDLGIKLSSSSSHRKAGSYAARDAGRAAGNNVNLNSGISGNRAQGALA